MIFHILINSSVPSNTDYLSDAFNQLAIKFSNMMHGRGHEVYFYGSGSKQTVNCTQYYCIFPDSIYEEIEREVSCNSGEYLIRDSEFRAKISEKYFNGNKYINLVKNIISINGIKENIICDFYSNSTSFFNNYFPFVLDKWSCNEDSKKIFILNPCELGGVCCGIANKVYCCNNWKVKSSEFYNINADIFTDNIIPPIFNAKDFNYSDKKEKVVLYLARIQSIKGVGEVLKLSKLRKDYKFWICGYHKDYQSRFITIDDTTYDMEEYDNVIFFGYVGTYQRKFLLSSASWLMQPSLYYEPFGFNIIEAYLSGTPVLTTNNGSFPEIVVDGITGHLCDSTNAFSEALDKPLNSIDCYNEGCKYNEDNIYERYMTYFRNRNLV